MEQFKFRLIAANDIASFSQLVTNALNEGYRFPTWSNIMITNHEDINGKTLQYSIAMILENPTQQGTPQ